MNILSKIQKMKMFTFAQDISYFKESYVKFTSKYI